MARYAKGQPSGGKGEALRHNRDAGPPSPLPPCGFPSALSFPKPPTPSRPPLPVFRWGLPDYVFCGFPVGNFQNGQAVPVFWGVRLAHTVRPYRGNVWSGARHIFLWERCAHGFQIHRRRRYHNSTFHSPHSKLKIIPNLRKFLIYSNIFSVRYFIISLGGSR